MAFSFHRIKSQIAAIATVVLCFPPLSAFAHHSTNRESDISKSVTIKGTICSVELINPHGRLYVHVKLVNGQTETWKLELPSMAALRGQVSSQTFKPGDSITVQAYPSQKAPSSSVAGGLVFAACPGSPAHALQEGHAREATLSNGQQLVFPDIWTLPTRQ